MCLVPDRNGDRIARDDRDGRKALAVNRMKVHSETHSAAYAPQPLAPA